MASSVESADGDIGFQIAPMVDVVFVLMLFFMASTGAQVLTKELRVTPPAHGGSSPTLIMVDIAADGTVLFNGETIAGPNDSQLGGVRARFQQVLQVFGDKDPVLIRPQSTVEHQRLVEVLQAIQGAGVSRVSFL